MRRNTRYHKYNIGDFVCTNGVHLHRQNMDNPYYHAIGVVEKKVDRVSGYDYEIRFPQTGEAHCPNHIILTNSGLRPATRGEGEAAFFIEVIRAEQAAEERHSKLLSAAKASADRASLKVEDF